FEGTAQLNDQGTATVSIPLAVDEHGRDYLARIEARVTDAGRREVAGASSAIATYGRFMLVASSGRFVYAPGEAATVDLRAIDYQGQPQAAVRVHVALARVEYRDGKSIVTAI